MLDYISINSFDYVTISFQSDRTMCSNLVVDNFPQKHGEISAPGTSAGTTDTHISSSVVVRGGGAWAQLHVVNFPK